MSSRSVSDLKVNKVNPCRVRQSREIRRARSSILRVLRPERPDRKDSIICFPSSLREAAHVFLSLSFLSFRSMPVIDRRKSIMVGPCRYNICSIVKSYAESGMSCGRSLDSTRKERSRNGAIFSSDGKGRVKLGVDGLSLPYSSPARMTR